jgi:ribosome-associated protein
MKIKGEFIQLNQLLKLMCWVNDGAMANDVIDNELVKVNGKIETRRRNKIKPGMTVEYNQQTVTVS